MTSLSLVAGLCAMISAEPDWPVVEKRALEFLQSYVKLQTVNPPADSRPAAALYKSELERHGLTPKLYESGPNGQTILIVRLPGKDRNVKPLLLLNHFDVVPVDKAAWKVDPFGGLIQDGYIWGRGTLDMKGIGTQQLFALTLLKDSGIVPSRDIVMLCTPDEETSGELGIQWMIKNHPEEINVEWALDEGGLGTRDIFSKEKKLIFGVAVGEKQALWLRLRAKGTAGHGSQPIPDNANMILMTAIQKALELPAGVKENRVVAEMKRVAGTPAENKFMAAIQKNTISLTTLTAGVGNPVKVNVIPSNSEATLDCRLLPGVNADEFISEMKARVNDPRITIERLSSPVDAGESPSDTVMFKALSAALRKHHPGAEVTPMLVPFGTDSVHLRKRKIPSYGFTPMILDIATIATMHSDSERIPVDQFLKGLHVYFDVLCSAF
jgi:acetylornithine deacetylase/succinyl-diaminopimelate desuccinylase-like protein